MSKAQLLTIDFLGKVNSSPQLAPPLHCHQHPTMKRPSTHSYLSKVKPHMLLQLLSQSNPCFSNPELSQREVSGDIKNTMELFPQHPTGFQSNSKDQSGFAEAAAAIHLQPSSTKPSSAQLTIFYNGAINVYDDVSAENAGAIIMLAAGNTNIVQDTYFCSDNGPVSSTLSNILNTLSLSAGLRTCRYTQSNGLKTPHTMAKSPIAKKLSLQRFLQKRNERVNRLYPYTTPSK